MQAFLEKRKEKHFKNSLIFSEVFFPGHRSPEKTDSI